MNQSAKAQEPSMEEILASIRRIIADDDTGKAAKPPEAAAPKPAAPPPAAAVLSRPAPVPPPAPRAPPPPPPRPAAPPAAANNQAEIDAMLADLEAPPKVAAAPAKPPAPKPAEPVSDVLDLTEAMATPPPGPAPSFRTIDGASDVVFTDPPEQKPPPRAAESRQAPPSAAFDQGLISNATVSAVDSAFNSLAMTVLGNNARTLEDLVKEMLRPMLKGWLDDNLPGLVERIVRAEIERVSRGRP
jgi:cell pole-organizing protein PopZ